MKIATKEIECVNECLTLTNQRALFWERERILILSDLHIGKTAHFRKAGIPIPSNILDSDLKRLENLIQYFDSKSILIVGDLFHAEVNKDIHTFMKWKETYETLDWRLIKGNHDRLKPKIYHDLNISVDAKLKDIAPFRFVHDVQHCNETEFCISGHTHPGVLIKGKGKQHIKLPCFQVTEKQLVLPAFSEFTGLNTSCSDSNMKCFAFTKTSVFEV